MIFKSTSSLSIDLTEWLSRSHDPEQPPLVVRACREGIEVQRADGSELSPDEHLEVFARLVVHALDPDCPTTMRRQPRRPIMAA